MSKRVLVLAIAGLWLLAAGSALAQSNESGAIPQRADIDPQYRWRLEDIYADQQSWEADYALDYAATYLVAGHPVKQEEKKQGTAKIR